MTDTPSLSPNPAPPPRLLLVDDDRANLESLVRIFAKEGIPALAVTNGVDALAVLRQQPIEVLVTDLMMPGMTGTELLRAVKAVRPEVEVIFITAYATVETAVSSMKEGAYDFITKPPKRHDLFKVVRQAFERSGLVAENRALKASLAELTGGGGRAIIGQSPAFRRVMEMMRLAAPSTATVLLLGESGTGKELFARAVHENSSRAKGAFIPINCGAIPDTLLESELFGYEKGAFTGAIARKEGRFERASGGTLFLDEVGELTPTVQVKLLRVLQEGEIERLGGSGPVPVDVRIVAGTNRDLKKRVEEGHFREDLFYRLNVVPITLPPLRERREDIPLLADHFLRRYAGKNQKPMTGFSPEARAKLEAHGWPGNIRELENVIERAVVLCRGNAIDLEDLPDALRAGFSGSAAGHIVVPIGMPMEEIELKVIHETLRHTKGDKSLAAKLLGIAARTIYRKLDREDDGPE
ncbi:MAG: sigma-54 dependent transcriptional regulator [Myxococcales bacterium]|jgi:two-component system response regulator HydG|nr:sigma-54 dependent transcriptional regulator [Myxococcales bacterium]